MCPLCVSILRAYHGVLFIIIIPAYLIQDKAGKLVRDKADVEGLFENVKAWGVHGAATAAPGKPLS